MDTVTLTEFINSAEMVGHKAGHVEGMKEGAVISFFLTSVVLLVGLLLVIHLPPARPTPTHDAQGRPI